MKKAERLKRTEVFFRNLYRNWSEPSGPCKGCPLRGGGVEPAFGGGDWTSRIAFVAINPNETKQRIERAETEVPDLRRYPSPSYEEFKNERKGKRYWTSSGKTFLFEREFSRILHRFGMSVEDIYFTNSQKCANEENNLSRDKEGRNGCRVHLGRELEALAPRLVVAFGREPWEAVQHELDADLPADDFPSKLRAMPNGETHLVGIYHWSNWGRNRHWVKTDKKYSQWSSEQLRKAMRRAGI